MFTPLSERDFLYKSLDKVQEIRDIAWMPAKLTTSKFIEKAVLVHGDKYDYSQTTYLGNDKKVEILCREHGVFLQRANDHLSKKAGCPECGGVARYTTDKFVNKAKKVHGELYDYSDTEYKNTETKVNISCREHGKFLQTPHDHLQGAGCPHCAGVARSSTEDFVKKATLIHSGRYNYNKVDYATNRKTVLIGCPQHGYFTQAPVMHLQGKGCPVCGGVKPMHTTDFIQKAVVVHGDTYSYERSTYTKKTDNITINCKLHGDFEQLPFNHLAGRGCPSCGCSNKSKPEDVLMGKLSRYNPVRDREILDGKELDLYFKGKKLAVEVNGIYWHSDVKKSNEYHLRKTLQCLESGVKLLHFTETEVNKKPDIVFSMIENSLGESKRIYARDCSVKVVAFNDYTEFFKSTHISGSVPAKIAFGLYRDGFLVSCMSFGKPRFDKNYEWEMLRFSSALNTVVLGAASKLFTAFMRRQNPTSVLSYADLRYGDGRVYEKLGFNYVKSTSPGYSYHHINGSVVSRMQAQKHKLANLLGDKFDATKSERDNMLSCGYMKMFDCGHKVFVWNKEITS